MLTRKKKSEQSLPREKSVPRAKQKPTLENQSVRSNSQKSQRSEQQPKITAHRMAQGLILTRKRTRAQFESSLHCTTSEKSAQTTN